MAAPGPGSQFGAYRVESVAGQGGMGVVTPRREAGERAAGVPGSLQRFKVSDAKFYDDSVVASFEVEAKPEPNPDRTAGIAFSWFKHAGDQQDETQYYGVTSHGIDIH